MCVHAQIVVDFSHSNKLELTKGDFAMPMIEAKVTPETRFMSVILELLTGAGMEVIFENCREMRPVGSSDYE